MGIYRRHKISFDDSGAPGLVNRVLALHAGSQGFDSHRGHMSERFFRSNRPGYPHPVSSELENSGIRVTVGDCGGVRLIKPTKLYMCTQNTTNTTRTDARRYENRNTHTHLWWWKERTSVRGMCNYGYVPLSHLGNVVMRMGTTISGDKLAIHRRVCVYQGRPTLQMVAAVGWCQLPDWSCLTHGFPRPSFGMKLLGWESIVTFVTR